MYLFLITTLYIFGILWGLSLNKIGLIPIFLILGISLNLIKSKIVNGKNVLILISIVLFGFVWTCYLKSDYNSKYAEEMITLAGEIKNKISDGEFYSKYLFITNNDKMLLYIPKTFNVKENDLIEVTRQF
jgi:hypothetical protein